jgi:hypothetical protein
MYMSGGEEEDTIKFILFGVLLLGVIYMGFKMYQAGLVRRSKEGFESAATTAKNGLTYNAKSFNTDITNNIEKLKDSISLSKYRSDYESIITNYEEYIQLLMLKRIVSTNNLTDNYETTLATINEIVQMDKSITVLHNLMNYIDNK